MAEKVTKFLIVTPFPPPKEKEKEGTIVKEGAEEKKRLEQKPT